MAREEPTIADRVYGYARAELGGRILSLSDVLSEVDGGDPSTSNLFGIDTLMEVSDAVVLLTHMDSINVDPLIDLRVVTQVRLRRVRDGAVLYDYRRGIELRDRHRFTEWAADDGRLMRGGIERTRRILSDRIVENLLLVYHDQRAAVSERGVGRFSYGRWSGFPSPPPDSPLAWGFAPINPPVQWPTLMVDSLQPTLSWRPLPRLGRDPARIRRGPDRDRVLCRCGSPASQRCDIRNSTPRR